MKKNTMMRLASALLVAVLLTTCAIAGTFAKYTYTLPEAFDTARVAKWGVTGTMTGTAFAKTYNLDSTVKGEFTLAVESETNVVAPGTTGTFTGVALTGTPEVAVRITTTAALDLGDNWMVAGDDGDDFYCPIVINVNDTDIRGLDYTSAEDFKTAVKDAIEAGNGDYAPNTDLSTLSDLNGNYTWTWAFDGDDAKDTALGDAAANGTAATIALTVSVTVEQID